MRSFLMILAGLAVLASGFWAYRENYATQAALREAARVNREIARLREALAVQNAEWAYLNRPDRLAELATANFDRLGLLPMLPEQFTETRHLPMPRLPGIEGAVDAAHFDDGDDLP
ncbi:MAG: cell division protein FtsL [Gemmobacter sp.]